MSWTSLPSHECQPLLCVTRVCQLILVQFQLGLSECGSHRGWSTTLLNHLIRAASRSWWDYPRSSLWMFCLPGSPFCVGPCVWAVTVLFPPAPQDHSGRGVNVSESPRKLLASKWPRSRSVGPCELLSQNQSCWSCVAAQKRGVCSLRGWVSSPES